MFLSYVLSFVFIGIYWNNHHHLLQAVEQVNGRILWANLHLLFWLSLVPFVTGWMGENHFAAVPIGALRRRAADARRSPTTSWCARSSPHHGRIRALARRWAATSRARSPSVHLRGRRSPLAFVNRWLGLRALRAVAMIWFVPDRRIERVFGKG